MPNFEGRLIDWLYSIPAALVAVLWYLYRGDRRRIQDLEAAVAQAITKSEVENIVNRVEAEFKDEHKSIINEVRGSNQELRDELRELRREIISVIRQPWNGFDRRKE